MKTKNIDGQLALLCGCVLLAHCASAQSGAPATSEQAAPMPGMEHSGMNHDDMPGMAQPPAKPSQPAQRRQEQSVSQRKGQGTTQGTNTSGDQKMPGMPGMEGMQGMAGMHNTPDAGQDMQGTQPAQGGKNTQQMQGMEGMHHIPEKAGNDGKQSVQGAPGMGSDMQGKSMSPMQGGKAPPDARDPNAYAEGTKPSRLGGLEMGDELLVGRVLFNNLEFAKSDNEHGQAIDAEAWYGGDYNKAWFKMQGERSDGRLQNMRTEALWNHTISPFWSTQLGVRHDTGSGDARNWLAFGVQGLAPYWFETEATAYWRAGGAIAARFDVRYELLFTQRLILEPELGANFYSQNDPQHATGSGLSNLEFGLRLRYEVRRQFAPYVGVSWTRRFGNTARFARTGGSERSSVAAVAGVRLWF